MDRIELKAQPRTVLRKKVRALRRQGIVPANVYGHAASTAIQVPLREAEQVISRAGRTQLISLTTDGEGPTTVVIKDLQRHPTTRSLLHMDFYRVAMTERLKVDVPLRPQGDPPGVKKYNGTLFQAVSTISAEALPADLPEAIDVDLSVLEELDSAIYVRDLQVPAGVSILADPDELIVRLLPPRVEVVEEVEEAEAAEAPEAAAEAEGEAESPKAEENEKAE
ncbi:MAG TPA: 50S ribosomal protein L25 [Chloroflexota bacterium]|nr:50S ribosomal protein L25 [Chloroflexota bacterium]